MKHVYFYFIVFAICGICEVKSQINQPIAIGETAMPVFNAETHQNDTTVEVNVLLNDFHPDGDPIEIAEVRNRPGQGNVTINFSDSIVSFIIKQNMIMEQAYDYRVREKGDTNSISNWATLVLNPGYGPDYPIAWNDTVIGMRGYPLTINILRNDVHPLGDSLFIYYPEPVNDSSVTIDIPYYSNNNYLKLYYVIMDSSAMNNRIDRGCIYIQLLNSEYYDSLNINNVNARFNCFGNHFWDMEENPQYKVPASGSASSIFAGTFWIGGLDDNNQLHMAAERYREKGEDYWWGPFSDVYDSLYDARWFHIWKLNRDDIEYHKSHWWEAGYEPLPDIASWPAHGDISLQQSAMIAPFEDHNNNGIYEPMAGEAPIIKGDQALFFVFNDARQPHTESDGVSLGIEIHAMAYAFDMPSDSALWNTTFLQYKIINRSDTVYTNVYASFFTDIDLGYAWDDYVGCNVEGGYYFVYNGNEIDAGGPEAYGENPPAQAVLFLGGPFMADDGLDNPKFDLNGNQMCDESLNGANFGDSIVDNERLGMTNFLYFNNGGAGPMSDPDDANGYYNYMQSVWKDDSHCIYGGNGHVASGGVGPECQFMFPGDTDPCNWGTNGIPPNGGLNQPGNYWTEESVGNNPNDRRGLGSSGPFTFAPGQVETLDLAFVWARAYDGNPWSSAVLLEEYCASIKNRFENDETFFMKVEAPQVKNNLIVYPNPAHDLIRVKSSVELGELTYEIYSMGGIQLHANTIKQAGHEFRINIAGLRGGVYLLRLIQNDKVRVNRFIKYD